MTDLEKFKAQKYMVVINKKTGRPFMAKEEYAKKLQRQGSHKIVAEEGEKVYKEYNTKMLNRNNNGS